MAEAPDLTVVGIDHHRTPIAERERLAQAIGDGHALEQRLTATPGVHGALVVTTCNRLECWFAGQPDHGAIADALALGSALAPAQVQSWSYIHRGETALRHLLRVACGLESMVMGEAQIQGQVRNAYERARTRSGLPSVLHVAFQRAIACGKEVRSATALGRIKVSTASVAADLARQVVGDLATARLLVVGAGDIAEEVLSVMSACGVRHVGVVNRTRDRADALAAHRGGVAHDWQQLEQLLITHDIVVCSTASTQPVITVAMVKAALRRRRTRLVMIDLAVPRDVEPAVSELEDAYLYHIDHLAAVASANRQVNDVELAQAEAHVEQHLRAALPALQPERQVIGAAVAAWFSQREQDEWERLLAQLSKSQHADGSYQPATREALHRLNGKFQHAIHDYLRRHADDPAAEAHIRDLLGL